MKFKDLKSDPIVYNGKSYDAWFVEVEPYHKVLFADCALLECLEEIGGVGNWLDDKIAYYVYPEQDVKEAIDEYND